MNIITGRDALQEAISYIQSPPLGIELPLWPKMSDMMGGLRMNEFTIFCGATGAGKTQWLSALASQLIANGTKTFVASVETGFVDFSVRILSVLSKYDFNTGAKMSLPEARKLMATIENNNLNFEHLFFSKHDNRVDVTEMVQTLHYMHDQFGVQVAILDNLNFFLKPVGSNNAIVEMDSAVHEFVMLAKKIPVHVVLVMHPKKTEGGKKSHKIFSEFDIKGSSTAVQEASNVLLMNRLDEDEVPTLGNAFTREFVFKKLRKRGFNVNKKFYLDYEGGSYVERNDPEGGFSPGARHTTFSGKTGRRDFVAP